MILATTTVEDVDRFLKVFGAKGADKRGRRPRQLTAGLVKPAWR